MVGRGVPGALRRLGLARLRGDRPRYMRAHGFARLKVGTPDDRAPHREGNFPTDTGKCMLKIEGATNFVAPPFRQMYEASSPANPSTAARLCRCAGIARERSGAGQALPAQHRLAQEPLLPEFLLRQHGGQAEGPGRAVRDDQRPMPSPGASSTATASRSPMPGAPSRASRASPTTSRTESWWRPSATGASSTRGQSTASRRRPSPIWATPPRSPTTS